MEGSPTPLPPPDDDDDDHIDHGDTPSAARRAELRTTLSIPLAAPAARLLQRLRESARAVYRCYVVPGKADFEVNLSAPIVRYIRHVIECVQFEF